MQNNLVLAGVPQPPRSSFLVETSHGVVAVSALPDNLPNERENLTTYVLGRLTSWTMASPAQPKRILKVQTIDTQVALNNYQNAAVLVLAPITGNLPVQVLKLRPPEPEPGLRDRVFVVTCRWTSDSCTQAVVEGTIRSGNLTADRKFYSYIIRLTQPLEPASSAGGAVLDEDGFVIGVMNGGSAGDGLVQADSLNTVMAR